MKTGRSSSLRRYVPARFAALAGVVLAGALLAAMPLQAAASTSYGVNLVKNAGAESGLTHWDTFPEPGFKTHKYGPPGQGFPSKAAGNAIGGGSHFFWAGQYDNTFNECPDAQQEMDLTGIGSAIDSGHVKVYLSAYAATSGAADIHAHVDLYFRNGNNHTVTGSDFRLQASSTNEAYKHKTASKVLTPHTRQLHVHIYVDGSTVATGGCAAFWDNISVIVKHV